MSALPFIGVIFVLFAEGILLARVVLPFTWKNLEVAFALPLSAFVNALVIVCLTLLGSKIDTAHLLGAHSIVIITLAIYVCMKKERIKPAFSSEENQRPGIISLITAMLIVMVSIYSLIHAAMLPTSQYDSATNWTMRSKISFYDKAIAFDSNEVRGMAKPQYPFLFHGLQITANAGQSSWSDAAANIILLLLSISSFVSGYLLLRRKLNVEHSLVTVGLIVSIPLVSVHLAQGYADINLLQYLLLATLTLWLWINESEMLGLGWLILSAIFVSAAVWTKSEGSVFGLLPWIVTIVVVAWKELSRRKNAVIGLTTAMSLSLLWALFAWIKDLSMTPHSSDTLLGFHPEGINEAFLGLFSRGSFGIVWYALSILIPLVITLGIQNDPRIHRRSLPILIPGIAAFILVLFVYLCTPNVRYLLNGESYYRQMMLPASLLILATSLVLRIDRKERH